MSKYRNVNAGRSKRRVPLCESSIIGFLSVSNRIWDGRMSIHVLLKQ